MSSHLNWKIFQKKYSPTYSFQEETEATVEEIKDGLPSFRNEDSGHVTFGNHLNPTYEVTIYNIWICDIKARKIIDI